MTDDDGHAISYKVLRRGTPVRGSDLVQVGTVRRVQDNVRENIFDGIVIDTPDGRRFVDAPEVGRVAEKWVTLTIPSTEVNDLPQPGSKVAARLSMSTPVRRAQRATREARRRWEDR